MALEWSHSLGARELGMDAITRGDNGSSPAPSPDGGLFGVPWSGSGGRDGDEGEDGGGVLKEVLSGGRGGGWPYVDFGYC